MLVQFTVNIGDAIAHFINRTKLLGSPICYGRKILMRLDEF
ncbi:hypothetical protein [Nodularia sp. UHCC 0506]|nr:hypothetical protein [Nodularia sp. UHCC 0506]MEA5514203.1 hypothetical protein [Nodularia sp. UHCC 0506]